ncbi:hypothetical protein CGH99_22395 [Vibrio parahaemolyticus]|nr:hypothetical protein EN02_000345 [Vibrio parahaemolyticus]TOL34904.1 hypothetical protein CGH99_22395 [Vibrio parahaemolyticus]TOL44826.1 hypothetical protein CGH96_23955 [Vibrio parahaemolyticus]TOL66346.1 hypothetical protein CGH92_23495 [Vibrio parahaemolyticus]TON16425.1 hypothetical protein CGH62_26765 [Vibrio parahaemolyticus]
MCRLKHFILSIVVSSILACIPLYIAVKHNSMGEFCTAKSLALSTCRYDFNYIFMVWGSWFVIIFVCLIVLTFLMLVVKRLVQKQWQ